MVLLSLDMAAFINSCENEEDSGIEVVEYANNSNG